MPHGSSRGTASPPKQASRTQRVIQAHERQSHTTPGGGSSGVAHWPAKTNMPMAHKKGTGRSTGSSVFSCEVVALFVGGEPEVCEDLQIEDVHGAVAIQVGGGALRRDRLVQGLGDEREIIGVEGSVSVEVAAFW